MNTEEAMDWLVRMNWSFLETDVAERVWDEGIKVPPQARWLRGDGT